MFFNAFSSKDMLTFTTICIYIKVSFKSIEDSAYTINILLTASYKVKMNFGEKIIALSFL